MKIVVADIDCAEGFLRAIDSLGRDGAYRIDQSHKQFRVHKPLILTFSGTDFGLKKEKDRSTELGSRQMIYVSKASANARICLLGVDVTFYWRPLVINDSGICHDLRAVPSHFRYEIVEASHLAVIARHTRRGRRGLRKASPVTCRRAKGRPRKSANHCGRIKLQVTLLRRKFTASQRAQ
jgi:hypothetical protein